MYADLTFVLSGNSVYFGGGDGDSYVYADGDGNGDVVGDTLLVKSLPSFSATDAARPRLWWFRFCFLKFLD